MPSDGRAERIAARSQAGRWRATARRRGGSRWQPLPLTPSLPRRLRRRPCARRFRSPPPSAPISLRCARRATDRDQYREYAERVRQIAGGLASLGVGHGDTVALMLVNRPEFNLVDTAALHLGAVPFSVYNTSAPEQIEYLFSNAGGRVVVTEPAFLPQVRAAVRRGGVAVERIVLVDGAEEGRSAGRARAEHTCGVRLRGRLERGRARGPPDADLHLRHDRTPEGRADHPRQHDG